MTSANTHAQEQTDQHCEETITEQVSPNPIKAPALQPCWAYSYHQSWTTCVLRNPLPPSTASQLCREKKQTAEFTTTFQLI